MCIVQGVRFSLPDLPHPAGAYRIPPGRCSIVGSRFGEVLFKLRMYPCGNHLLQIRTLSTYSRPHDSISGVGLQELPRILPRSPCYLEHGRCFGRLAPSKSALAPCSPQEKTAARQGLYGVGLTVTESICRKSV